MKYLKIDLHKTHNVFIMDDDKVVYCFKGNLLDRELNYDLIIQELLRWYFNLDTWFPSVEKTLKNVEMSTRYEANDVYVINFEHKYKEEYYKEWWGKTDIFVKGPYWTRISHRRVNKMLKSLPYEVTIDLLDRCVLCEFLRKRIRKYLGVQGYIFSHNMFCYKCEAGMRDKYTEALLSKYGYKYKLFDLFKPDYSERYDHIHVFQYDDNKFQQMFGLACLEGMNTDYKNL